MPALQRDQTDTILHPSSILVDFCCFILPVHILEYLCSLLAEGPVENKYHYVHVHRIYPLSIPSGRPAPPAPLNFYLLRYLHVSQASLFAGPAVLQTSPSHGPCYGHKMCLNPVISAGAGTCCISILGPFVADFPSLPVQVGRGSKGALQQRSSRCLWRGVTKSPKCFPFKKVAPRVQNVFLMMVSVD